MEPDLARAEALAARDRLNFTGVVLLTDALLPLLMARPAAAVVNVTSRAGAGAQGRPRGLLRTKAAVRSFTMALAHQARARAPQLRVIEALPPMVDTAMTAGRGRGKISPEACAAEILDGVAAGKARIYVGASKLLRAVHGFRQALRRASCGGCDGSAETRRAHLPRAAVHGGSPVVPAGGRRAAFPGLCAAVPAGAVAAGGAVGGGAAAVAGLAAAFTLASAAGAMAMGFAIGYLGQHITLPPEADAIVARVREHGWWAPGAAGRHALAAARRRHRLRCGGRAAADHRLAVLLGAPCRRRRSRRPPRGRRGCSHGGGRSRGCLRRWRIRRRHGRARPEAGRAGLQAGAAPNRLPVSTTVTTRSTPGVSGIPRARLR
jgi:hypothetical protein